MTPWDSDSLNDSKFLSVIYEYAGECSINEVSLWRSGCFDCNVSGFRVFHSSIIWPSFILCVILAYL